MVERTNAFNIKRFLLNISNFVLNISNMKNRLFSIIVGCMSFAGFTFFTFKDGYSIGVFIMWLSVSVFMVYGLYRHLTSKKNKMVYDAYDKKLNIYASAKTLPFVMIIWVLTTILIEHEDVPTDLLMGISMLAVVVIYFLWILTLKRKGFPND